METVKEQELWRLAKKRVSFKRHLLIYMIVNVFFWCIWWFDEDNRNKGEFPWPVWSMLGWGVGLAFEYVSVYHSNKPDAIEKEYEKIKKERVIELPDDLMSLIDKVILELLPEECGIKKFNEKIHKTSSNKFKKNRLRIDFTSMGDSDKLFFQAMAQENRERLYYCQHGSDYMTQKKLWGFNAVETRGEGFIKWGEEDLPGCHGLKFVTASSPFFSRIANKHKCSRDEVIFVGTIYYVLFNGICSKEPSYFFDYINAKHRFLSILSSDVIEKMWYRPWVHKEYWNNFDDFEFVNHYFPSIRELSGNLKKRMLACKILVLDHYGTCFYEAMVSNTPVMMYYAHPQATKHPQADLMFSKLKSIGIIHDTPDSAAKMINEIWPDVKTWWQSKDVQNLRNEFCTKYALTNKFWRLEWAKMVWNQ